MNKALRFFSFVMLFATFSIACNAQRDSLQTQHKANFQIFLKQPAKEIKLLMYEKSFLPIQGRLSDDGKAIIMKDYERGNKVRIKVIYDDGTVEEFTKSPCFIDPVIS